MSIPFLGLLRDIWPKGQFIVTGVLGPHSNAHGPNEFLHIPYVKKLICSIAHIIAKRWLVIQFINYIIKSSKFKNIIDF